MNSSWLRSGPLGRRRAPHVSRWPSAGLFLIVPPEVTPTLAALVVREFLRHRRESGMGGGIAMTKHQSGLGGSAWEEEGHMPIAGNGAAVPSGAEDGTAMNRATLLPGVFLASMLLVSPAFAVDVTGTWQGEWRSPAGAWGTVTLQVVQQGTRITGEAQFTGISPHLTSQIEGTAGPTIWFSLTGSPAISGTCEGNEQIVECQGSAGAFPFVATVRRQGGSR